MIDDCRLAIAGMGETDSGWPRCKDRHLRIQLQRKASTFAECAALSMLSGRPEWGYGKKEFKNIYVRSHYVYENKQNNDKMPEKKRAFSAKFRTFSANRHEFCRISE
jgi:hypothetical protein